MPTPTKGARLGGSPAHERSMLANLATSLFEHGRITTTQAKARKLRPYAEKLITKAKHAHTAQETFNKEAPKEERTDAKGNARTAPASLHQLREIRRVIRDRDIVHKLITEIGPFFTGREGGYTRIIKTIPRKGDNAPMAIIELVQERTVTAEAESARKTRFTKDEKAKSAKGAEAKVDAVAETDAEDSASGDEHPYGEGSHAPLEDGSQPEGFPIKGNADSMLYHVPDSRFYNNTVAEVWFATAEAAESAGFQLPPSQREDKDEASDTEGES